MVSDAGPLIHLDELDCLELLCLPSKSTLHIRPSLLEEIVREVEDSKPV